MRKTERGKEEGGGRGSEGGVEREIECVCAFACVCERERVYACACACVSEHKRENVCVLEKGRGCV